MTFPYNRRVTAMLNATHISHSYSHHNQFFFRYFFVFCWHRIPFTPSLIQDSIPFLWSKLQFKKKSQFISMTTCSRFWFYFDVSTYDFLSLSHSVVCFFVVAHAYNVARFDMYNARFRVNKCRKKKSTNYIRASTMRRIV